MIFIWLEIISDRCTQQKPRYVHVGYSVNKRFQSLFIQFERMVSGMGVESKVGQSGHR